MHFNDVLHQSWIGVVNVGLVYAIRMGTFHPFVILVPAYPFWFDCAFIVELVIIIPFALREGFVTFLTLVKRLDLATFLARD